MLLRYPNPNGGGNEVEVADISSYPPVVNVIGYLSYVRYTGNLTCHGIHRLGGSPPSTT
jgi:hypothetical protein